MVKVSGESVQVHGNLTALMRHTIGSVTELLGVVQKPVFQACGKSETINDIIGLIDIAGVNCIYKGPM
jgi:hypothetical protein